MQKPVTNAARKKRNALLIVFPLAVFTLLFVLFPFLYLLAMSVSSNTASGVFTISNYQRLFESVYWKVYLDSLVLGFFTTILVTLLGYPFGYFMAKLTKNWKRRFNYLLMVPFCVSSLLRLYGWDILLRADGIINKTLLFLGVISQPLHLKYTFGATIAGMVYALLPFMIFSVYSSAEKLDWSLVEASRDLGASPFKAFCTISLPLTLPGLMSGVILTFIPSMGLIFISEILGGNKIILVGNLIVQEATQGKNQPFAAALSVVLMLLTSLFIWAYKKLFGGQELEGLV